MAEAAFWRIGELAERLGLRPQPVCHRLDPGQRLTGVSTDSRSLRPGALFVPLRGENFDGHDFIPDAIAAGAAAVLVEKARPGLAELVQRWPGTLFLPVADTLETLGKLARLRCEELRPVVFAVTGSNGKTTTRQMLAAILARRFRVHQSQGNFNNLIGLPLTILTMPADCEVLVLEMGMNRPGELTTLSAIARPDYLLLTNVAAAHLEGLGSLAAVAQAKCEAITGVRDGGWVIYNGDDLQLADLVPVVAAGRRAGLNLLPVSWHGAYSGPAGCEPALAQEIWLTPAGSSFVFSRGERGARIELACWGRHNVFNAALALAAAGLVRPEIGLDEAAAALADFRPPAGRLELHHLARGITLVDDAYNANPASMAAALSEVSGRRRGRFLALVLGGMWELGAMSAKLHAELGRRVAEIRPDLLLLLGEAAALSGRAAQAAGLPAARIVTLPEDGWEAAVRLLQERLPDAGLVLVKGSRAARLERVVVSVCRFFGKESATAAAVAERHG